MGKLTQFEVLLDSPETVYRDGELVKGEMIVSLNEDMRVKEIRLDVKGNSYVHWSESTSKRQRIFTASETYIDDKIVLFGKDSEDGADHQILSAGRHTYPFQYELPEAIPSSIKGSYGKIHYWILGRISEPWKLDHTTKRPFTIVNEVDLNTKPSAAHGDQGGDSKMLCCWCCKSGPISCRFQLERRGYALGESIPIRGEIINYSNRPIRKSYAELLMMITYRGKYLARRSTNTSIKKIAEISRGYIPPGDSDIWNGSLLPIPHVPPTGLFGCDIMSVSYAVNLCVQPEGPSTNLEVPLQIIIGTIPLRGTQQQRGTRSRAPNPNSTQRYQERSYEQLTPPPSYAESSLGVDIHRGVVAGHTSGKRFVPNWMYAEASTLPRPSPSTSPRSSPQLGNSSRPPPPHGNSSTSSDSRPSPDLIAYI